MIFIRLLAKVIAKKACANILFSRYGLFYNAFRAEKAQSFLSTNLSPDILVQLYEILINLILKKTVGASTEPERTLMFRG